MSATTMQHRVSERAARIPGASILARYATYAFSVAGIYLSVGFLFYYAAKGKLIDESGTMPAGLVKAFHGSFFASVPGDNAAWVILGAMEATIVVLLAISLLNGEFLPQRRKPVLLAALGFALLTLSVMIVANSMIGKYRPGAGTVHLSGRRGDPDVHRPAVAAVPPGHLDRGGGR